MLKKKTLKTRRILGMNPETRLAGVVLLNH